MGGLVEGHSPYLQQAEHAQEEIHGTLYVSLCTFNKVVTHYLKAGTELLL